MEKNQNPWTFPVAVDDIPETGLHIEIDAPEAVRAELRALAGLRELRRLSAVFDLERRGAGVRVNGQVRARIGQTCVVTLEPVESDLEESGRFGIRTTVSRIDAGQGYRSADGSGGTTRTFSRRQIGLGRNRD